jgi:tRNA threonylcarbamoyladenosine biosynthesis protein TsaE
VNEDIVCKDPDDTFELGRRIGGTLRSGDVVLLYGGLGAGKTLLTKGMLAGLDFDVDEVTSPSFTLVNQYKTDKFDVFHIDLWRLDDVDDAANAVGLEEIIEDGNSVAVIEWAERLRGQLPGDRTIAIEISGDGMAERQIKVTTSTQTDSTGIGRNPAGGD